MPPKVKVTKEKIGLEAFELVRQEGITALNARELAKRLGCSTQPIFSSYESMDALEVEMITRAEKYQEEFVMGGAQEKIPFLGIGVAYIRFAHEEPHLFSLLFLSDKFVAGSFIEIVQQDNTPLTALIAQTTGLNQEQAQRLLLKLWLMVHGMATMVAGNHLPFFEQEIRDLLKETYEEIIKSNREKN